MNSLEGKCRLCSSEKSGIVNIFGDKLNTDETETTYASQIAENFQLALTDNPGWPKKCCSKCVNFMEAMKKFKTRIIQTHWVLEKVVEQNLEKPMETQLAPETPDGNLFESVFIVGDAGSSKAEEKPSSTDTCPDPETFSIYEDSNDPIDGPNHDDHVTGENETENDNGKVLEVNVSDDDQNDSEDSAQTVSDDSEEYESDDAQDNDDSDDEGSDEESEQTIGHVGVPKSIGVPKKRFRLIRLTEEEFELQKLLKKLNVIKCNICKKKTDKYLILEQHMRLEHQSSVTSIICCGSEHKFRPGIFDHMRYHLNPAAFRCSICDKCFKYSSVLKRHTRKEHTKREKVFRVKKRLTEEEEKVQDLMREMDLLKCHLCAHRENDYKSLSDHYKLKHGYKMYATIQCCNQLFIRRMMAFDHVHCHLNPDAFKCLPCDKRHLNSKGLNTHNRIHHSEEPEVVCQPCKRSFSSVLTYRKHMRMRHVPEEKKPKCSYCQKVFPNNESLKIHIRRMHEKVYTHICHICGKAFVDGMYLDVHLRTHTEKPAGEKIVAPQRLRKSTGKEHQCDICQKYYASLERHKSKEHGIAVNKKTKFCEKCGLYKAHFKAHYSRCGEPAAELANCHLCEKKFGDERRLKIHIFQTHDSTRDFACPHCDFKSVSVGHRLRHIKYSHPEELHKYQVPASGADAAGDDPRVEENMEDGAEETQHKQK